MFRPQQCGTTQYTGLQEGVYTQCRTMAYFCADYSKVYMLLLCRTETVVGLQQSAHVFEIAFLDTLPPGPVDVVPDMAYSDGFQLRDPVTKPFKLSPLSVKTSAAGLLQASLMLHLCC